MGGINTVVPAQASEIGGTIAVSNGGTGSSSFTAGSIIFSNGSILTQDNSNLFWDDSNNRLGLGTTGPNLRLEVRQATTAGQLRLAYDATNYFDFKVSSIGNMTLTPVGNNFTYGKDAAGVLVNYSVFNDDNTSASSHARITINVGGSSAGDPTLVWGGAGTTWIAGVDNSDSDKWKLQTGNSLTTSHFLSVDTSGNVSIANALNVGTAVEAAAAGEFSTGITSSGRMRFKRRSQAVLDGLASEGTAFIDGSGWLRIAGNNSDEYFDFSTYRFGQLVSFRHAEQQIEFWGWEGTTKNDYQACFTLVSGIPATDRHNRVQVRSILDDDSIELTADATNGPLIATETGASYSSLDLGLARTHYIRLTSSTLQLNSAHSLTWSSGAVGAASDITLARASAGLLDLTGSLRVSGTLTLSGATATRVAFFGASGLLTDDGGLTYNNSTDALTVSGRLFVGTATDAAAQGDFVAGLTGNARLFYDQSAAALTMYSTDGSDEWVFTTRTDGNLRITSQATAPQLQWQEDKSGQEMILLVRNTSTTNASSHATIEPFTSSSGGDPKVVWGISGGTSWHGGPDNSDSDTFKIGTGTSIGTGTLFFIESGGTVGFGTHSAIGAETVTGYITIKDAAGNTRKLAVVS